MKSCSAEETEGWFPGLLGNMRDALVTHRINTLPTVQETRVQSLGQVDALEKDVATHSSIRAWEISWDREPGGLQSTRSQRVRHDRATSLSSL